MKNLVQYECFSDSSYYDLWCVRKIGEKRWGYCYHLNSKEEAEGLTEELNRLNFNIAKLKEGLDMNNVGF